MSKKIPERKLWKIVKEGLEKKEYKYICSNPDAKRAKLREGFLTMGIGGVLADVIGFKDVGTVYQPKLEVIAVEVKPHFPNYRQRHIDQAKRASFYAHKCFFAAPREFKPEEIEVAVNSGIGLFQIDVKNKRLKQVAPPQPMYPHETDVVRLMGRLNYFKCTICDCYWNGEFAPIGYRAQNYFSRKVSNKFYKFICSTCKQKLFKILSPELKERYAEEWKVERLNRKTSRIDKKVEVWVNWLERRMLAKNNKLEKRIDSWFSWLERRDNRLQRQLKSARKHIRRRAN